MNKLNRFTCLDIITYISDVSFEPVRKLSKAKYFIKDENWFFIPCEMTDPCAFEYSLNRFDNNFDKLKIPILTIQDFILYLFKYKPYVKEELNIRYEDFK